MKFLFVNACIRGEDSRTYQLCRDYIEKFKEAKKNEDWTLEEVNLNDMDLIGAPYWDLAFPAKLKIYIERCSVTGLTFIYSPEGIPEGQCRAKSLSYVTTSGSAIKDFNFGYEYIKGICALFGIKKTYFASAEELDIIGKDVPKIMAEAKDKITDIIDSL